LEKSSLPKTRHDQVVYHGIDDFAKRSADDDAHGEIYHVSLNCELTKFLHHAHGWLHLERV